MIIHETENGQRVAFSTAESSWTEDGVIHFLDKHGVEVGRQPVVNVHVEEHKHDVKPQLESEPPKEPPIEPPHAPVEVPEPPKEN